MEWDCDLIGPIEAKLCELKQLKEAHYLSLVAKDPQRTLDGRIKLMQMILADLQAEIDKFCAFLNQ